MSVATLPVFNWDELDVPTQQWLFDKTNLIKDATEGAKNNLLEIGEALVDVRDKLPDTKFSEWLRQEFGWSRATAYRYIQIFERFGQEDRRDLVKTLSVTILYYLAAPSTPESETEAVADAIKEGNTVEEIEESVKEKKKAKRKPRKPKVSKNDVSGEELYHADTTQEENGEVIHSEDEPEIEVFDEVKQPVPESLHEVFSARSEFKQFEKRINEINRDLATFADKPGFESLRAAGTVVESQSNGEKKESFRLRYLSDATACLRNNAPYAICPAENCLLKSGKTRKNCQHCKGRGWVVRSVWKDQA